MGEGVVTRFVPIGALDLKQIFLQHCIDNFYVVSNYGNNTIMILFHKLNFMVLCLLTTVKCSKTDL